jgi:hypothetical protein
MEKPENVDATEWVVAGMLIENTGTHFLDSGGTAGRAWQVNQSKVSDSTGGECTQLDALNYFKAQPRSEWGYSGEWVSINLFHWLTEQLEYDPVLTESFRSCDCGDDSAETRLEAFATANRLRLACHDNTYNRENNLSQDIIYAAFTGVDDAEGYDDDNYLAVSIHNGADARGGYTDYQIFRVIDCPWFYLDYESVHYCATPANPLVAWERAGQTQLEGVAKPASECTYYADTSGYTGDASELVDDAGALAEAIKAGSVEIAGFDDPDYDLEVLCFDSEAGVMYWRGAVVEHTWFPSEG